MSFTRLFDIARHQLENFPRTDSLNAKVGGEWKTFSSTEIMKMSDALSAGLIKLGINPGDRISIISNNRPEWNIADYGMMQIGAVNVPLYPNITDDDLHFVLNDAQVKAIFVSGEDWFRRVSAAQKKCPSLHHIFTFDKINGARNWEELLAEENPEVKKISDGVKPGDLATIIYTSGTTGNPKGVMLSHHNIVSNCIACTPYLPVDNHSRALSFLPLNHIFERMVFYILSSRGVGMYYAQSRETIGDDMKDVKPQLMTVVPYLLEKIYTKIMTKGMTLTGIKRALFFWSVNLGLQYDDAGKNSWWYNFRLSIARALVFKKWQAALGGNIVALVSGGAALQPRLARVFAAAGVPVLEGYGLTETSPVVAVNHLTDGEHKIGTVGFVAPCNEVKIAEDGEILVKGSNVMIGYYNRPDLTAEAIDKDGWFHTGDIGEFTPENFLRITDRKKEMFKTSSGKYVAPQVIENKFKESNFIEQMMVIGDGMKFVSALIVPNMVYLREWCARHLVVASERNEELVVKSEVIARMQQEVDSLNAGFSHVEQIKKFRLLADEWTVDSGELTPTLKLRRKIIAQKNKAMIDVMYAE